MWNCSTVEWIDIEVTSYCGLKCPGCLREQLGKYIEPYLNKDKLSLDLLKEKINKEVFPNLKTINFCGSIDEPMAHPEIQKIAEWVTGMGCFLNINTSGSLRLPKFWNNFGSFLSSYPHSILFGIDGVGETSERYRVGSDWKLVRNNARAFIQSGGKAVWQFIAFEWNEHQIEDARNESMREGFDGFRLIWSHRDKSGEVRKDSSKRSDDTLSGLPTEPSSPIHNLSCRYLQKKRLFLSHKGYLLPCCHLNSDTLKVMYGNYDADPQYALLWQTEGQENININKRNIPEILDSDYFHGIIDSWNTQPLSRCISTCSNKNYDILEDDKWKTE